MGNKLCEAQSNCACQEEHGIEGGLVFTSLGWGSHLEMARKLTLKTRVIETF